MKKDKNKIDLFLPIISFEYKVFYTKPVSLIVSKIYQTEDGLQYVVVDHEEDKVQLSKADWESGFIYEKTINNFLSNSVHTEINLLFNNIDIPIETKIHYMSKDNQIIETKTYLPEEVTNVQVSESVEYIIIETISKKV